ncbi:uncharacterized protein LOC127283806 [Leptopilina boulardi]|uniref:uncharacterized protein LOC127283806 n=1 Tax=Leptopilina boulardi TaxID=63433 RepID=UPI0021F5BC68|nr:uncharacterized protein LOC127283806 [Leptopilina boulardi]
MSFQNKVIFNFNFAPLFNRWKILILRQKEVKYNFDFAVQLNRWSMQLCGMWPIEDRFSKLRFYIVLIFLLCLNIPATIQCFLVNDLFKEVETIFVTINLVFVFIKALFIGISKQKLTPLIQDMIVNWNDTTLSKESKNVMIYNLKRARFINTLYLTLMYGAFILFIIRPLIRCGDEFSQKCLPCPAYYPFDIQKSPNYELAYLTHIFLMGCAVTVTLSVNIFLTVVVFHLCGQIQILALNIKDIVNPRNISDDKSINPKECKFLCNFVKHHLKLIRLCSSCE